VSPRLIPEDHGLDAIATWLRDQGDGVVGVDVVATACRYTLQRLQKLAPGRAVEVRVPPYSAVQVIAGPSHTRGTPPAVIEMTPQVWLALALGQMEWSTAVQDGLVDSSGHRANLQQWLPLPGLG
jgi:hypothetical protein